MAWLPRDRDDVGCRGNEGFQGHAGQLASCFQVFPVALPVPQFGDLLLLRPAGRVRAVGVTY